jgi:Uncharacterized ACR, COG1430
MARPRKSPPPGPESPLRRSADPPPRRFADPPRRRLAGLPQRRFANLPQRLVADNLVPVAVGVRARLLGLALLDREAAGPGLLIPRCASVHTFGMRFAIDVFFLGPDDEVLDVRPAVPPQRFVAHRGAIAVLEIPA